METYRQTAQARAQARRKHLAIRRVRAWEVARQAALLLKEEYGVTQVALFGSLLQPNLFHLHSDVDLAVWGLAERDYYRAVSHLLSLEPAISIDLVEIEYASPRLQKKIECEGKLL